MEFFSFLSSVFSNFAEAEDLDAQYRNNRWRDGWGGLPTPPEEELDRDVAISPLLRSQPCQLQVGNEKQTTRSGCTNIRGPECTILPLTSSGKIDQTKYPYKTANCADSDTHLVAPPISNNNLPPEAVLLPETNVLTEDGYKTIAIGGKRKSKRGRRKTKRRKQRRKTKRRRKSRRKRKTLKWKNKK